MAVYWNKRSLGFWSAKDKASVGCRDVTSPQTYTLYQPKTSYLDPFTRVSHLLVRFCRIGLFLLLLWEHAQFAHDPKQALRLAGIAALF